MVGEGAGDGAGGEVFDFVPFFAVKAYAGEAFAAGEDDAAALVVPGVLLVLAEDGELDAVDAAEFVEAEAEGFGDEHVDLHQGLPPRVVRPQCVVPVPGVRELAEAVGG